jgi:hypothetical protein
MRVDLVGIYYCVHSNTHTDLSTMTFTEFYHDVYVPSHTNKSNLKAHKIGCGLLFGCCGVALMYLINGLLIHAGSTTVVGVVTCAACATCGHYLFEKNKPVYLSRHPKYLLYAIASFFKMCFA